MNDTPRTDAAYGYHELIKESQRIERELNEANAKIKRLENFLMLLEEAGDAMFPWSERVGQEFWNKAKEAKP